MVIVILITRSSTHQTAPPHRMRVQTNKRLGGSKVGDGRSIQADGRMESPSPRTAVQLPYSCCRADAVDVYAKRFSRLQSTPFQLPPLPPSTATTAAVGSITVSPIRPSHFFRLAFRSHSTQDRPTLIELIGLLTSVNISCPERVYSTHCPWLLLLASAYRSSTAAIACRLAGQ